MKLVERNQVQIEFTREEVEQILRRAASTLRPDMDPGGVEFAVGDEAAFATVAFQQRRPERRDEAVPSAVDPELASPGGVRGGKR